MNQEVINISYSIYYIFSITSKTYTSLFLSFSLSLSLSLHYYYYYSSHYAVGPTALLVGGTAVLYHSLLHHPSSTLTPLSVLYMLLLAIQTSLQPRLSRKYIPPHIPKVQVALAEEVIKTTVASAILVSSAAATTSRLSFSSTGISIKDFLNDAVFQDWTLSSSLLVAGMPAMLYALQGVLTYRAHQQLDSVTFNGLSQTKTLWAALCCYLVMGKRQSALQMVALGGLLVAAWLFQRPTAPKLPTKTQTTQTSTRTSTDTTQSTQESSPSSSSTKTLYDTLNDNDNLPAPQDTQNNHHHPSLSSSSHQSKKRSTWWWVATAGVLPCLAATFLSGLAGAFSQKGLQMVGGGGSGRNAFLYTVEVSFFSALTLLMTTAMTAAANRRSRSSRSSNSAPVGEKQATTITKENHNSTDNRRWTWQTYIPIGCKALGGILTALVHKHAGSVVKGFALMLGLVMSGILQSLWFASSPSASTGGSSGGDATTTATVAQPRNSLPMNQVAGIVVVMFSSWLHFTNPPV